MGAIDLHAHTTASDGTLAPRELVALAAKKGVRVLAVTDHDSTSGIAEARAAAAAHPGLTIVPGIEINCDVEGAEVHVLGYFLDLDAAWFQEFLAAQREERRARIHRILDRLAALGVFVDAAEVFALVREGSAGRPHVAQAMVHRGYVKSVREAFDRYLHNGGPASAPRRRLTPEDAVAVIRRARGVPVIAHPGLANRDAMIDGLVAAGLMGIESYYPEHSAAQTQSYLALCARHGLVATGGSDFHGPTVGHAPHPGAHPVPDSAWTALREKAVAVGAPVEP
ncbi:MAG: PHP domain-containing protein [Candidatus Rokubacteria bacterium]|nr:PHP domain-containing protein [Candidatus Rokubacteria bacterium]